MADYDQQEDQAYYENEQYYNQGEEQKDYDYNEYQEYNEHQGYENGEYEGYENGEGEYEGYYDENGEYQYYNQENGEYNEENTIAMEEHVDEEKQESEEGSKIDATIDFQKPGKFENEGLDVVVNNHVAAQAYKEDILREWRARREEQEEADEQEYLENKKTYYELAKETYTFVRAFLNGEFGESSNRHRMKFLRDVIQGDYFAIRIWLLKYGQEAEFVNCRSHLDGKTALCIAVRNGDARSTQLLLRRKVDPNIQDAFGCVPLHYSCEKGDDLLTSDLLAKKAEVDTQDNNGITPLMQAVSGNHYACTAMLVQNGASINIRDTFNKWSALHYAASKGYFKITKLLLKSGGDRFLLSRERLTPTDLALDNSHSEVALYLQNWKVE